MPCFGTGSYQDEIMVHLKDSIKIDTKLILKLGNACLNYIIIFVHDCEMLNIFFFYLCIVNFNTVYLSNLTTVQIPDTTVCVCILVYVLHYPQLVNKHLRQQPSPVYSAPEWVSQA